MLFILILLCQIYLVLKIKHIKHELKDVRDKDKRKPNLEQTSSDINF
ncbi:MAG: hypothetical protein FWF50_04590 [Defluviitaleaceae bacterium]|nr:hypothetical protein [Defluviitaleaceae bacterium]